MENKEYKIHLVGVPEAFEGTISNVAQGAVGKICMELQYDDDIITVVFEAQPEFVIPEIGLMGRAVGKKGLEVYIDFGREYGSDELETELTATIYHEAAHLVRENTLGLGNTLLDSAVSEGISCYIEKHFYPNRTIPYIAPIEGEEKHFEAARQFFDKKEYNHGKWFFGSETFPRWVGYRLGFVLVDAYMQKKQAHLDQLVRTESRDILAGSELF